MEANKEEDNQQEKSVAPNPYMQAQSKKKKKPEGKRSVGDVLKKDHHDHNMVVAVRVRPMSSKEIQKGDFDIIQIQDKLIIVMDRVEIECSEKDKKPDVLHRSKELRYFFDRIFTKKCTTEKVYQNTCLPLIPSVLSGYNACVFAYGTTGSGKTFTMTGTPEEPGIMVLILKDLFAKIQDSTEKKFSIKMSYVEIYNEVIRDLLLANSKDTYLDLRDDPIKGVCIAGVTEFTVGEPKEVMNLLTIGNKRRTTEATMANAESSRSHAICQIMLVAKDKIKNTEEEVLQGKLSLIDLAGSERGTVTENRGIRLREGAKINTSLLALANCINALGDKSKKGFFVPFRDSKLTRMLKDSLGGNCKTVMITTVSPAAAQYEETINTLKYANRAKNIKMRVEPNKKLVSQHISAYKNIIADLRDEIDKLKSQLQSDIANKANPLATKHTGMYQRNAQLDVGASMGANSNQLAASLDGASMSMGTRESNRAGSLKGLKCMCEARYKDEEQKQAVMAEIHLAYEEILQLEQALIELDEQNTTNTLEIRKREAKEYFLVKQLEEIDEILQSKENQEQTATLKEQAAVLQKQVHQHRNQIEILGESTKQNLLKRQSMKSDLYQYYSKIRTIRESILTDRIKIQDNKDFLELVIKNNFLESQNVQLLLNLQLQARTIIDLKNMIGKQQKFIEDNDIGAQATGENIDIFLGDDEEEEAIDEELDDIVTEETKNTEGNTGDQINIASGIEGVGYGIKATKPQENASGRANSQLTKDKPEKDNKPLGFQGFGGIVGVSAGGQQPVKRNGATNSATNAAKKRDDPKSNKPTPASKDGGNLSMMGVGITGTGIDSNKNKRKL